MMGYNYFVSYTFEHGTGCTVIETARIISNFKDINEIKKNIEKDGIKNVIIMNIQRLPI